MSINQSSCLSFAFKGLMTDFVCGTLAHIQEFDHKVREVTPKKLSCLYFTSTKLEQSLQSNCRWTKIDKIDITLEIGNYGLDRRRQLMCK
jgi:hypothetical protein